MEVRREMESGVLRREEAAVESSSFLARYGYRMEQAAKTIGSYGANGLVLEQLPALVMFNRVRH